MAWLNDDDLQMVRDAAIKAKLVGKQRRTLLFQNVHENWAYGLAEVDAPLVQLGLDLLELNREGRLVDGTVPFLQWLNNAVRLAGPTEGSVALAAARDSISTMLSVLPALTLPVREGEELVLFEPNYLPVAFLRSGASKMAAIARLEVPRYMEGKPRQGANGEPELGLGTGCLVAPGILLTAHHVIDARGVGEDRPTAEDWDQQFQGTMARFDFDEAEAAGTAVGMARVIAKNRPLDYCLVELRVSDPKRPYLVEAPTIEKNRPANILQHPSGRAKEVALRNNIVHEVTETTVQYFTDTEGGSSGSPVCDDLWRMMAVHRSWKRVVNITFQGKKTAYVNEGTTLSAIITDAGAAWAQSVGVRRA